MSILVDSSVFCAYANVRDVHHGAAKVIIGEIASGKHGRAVTTDYIFDESVTVALRKANKKTAVELGGFILDSELLLAEINSHVFKKAWDLFRKDGALSFTDCTSVAFMSLFGISKIATFDRDFKGVKGVEVVGF